MRLHAEIFQGKGYIFLYNRRDNLIIRVLEHHPYLLPDIEKIALILCVHPQYRYRTAFRKANGVKMFGKSRFSAPVVP